MLVQKRAKKWKRAMLSKKNANKQYSTLIKYKNFHLLIYNLLYTHKYQYYFCYLKQMLY